MSSARPPRTSTDRRTRRSLVVGLLTAITITAACALGSSPPSSLPQGDALLTTVLRRPTTHDPGDTTVTEEDGTLPDGVTPFDDQHPGVTRLDPELLDALRHAATDAARDGTSIHVSSGWRSADHQDQLLREAIAEHGSEREAARWVARADSSPHVTGDAVDVGPADARAWLSVHGAAYGLCPTYGNEPWHHELRPQAVDGGCPDPYPDPTHDPRMQEG